MNIKKSIWVLFTAISVCFAQTYNISGIVTDTGTTPISGAVVRLEKAGLTATSGADGRFAITGTVGVQGKLVRPWLQRPAVTLLNGLISLDLKEPAGCPGSGLLCPREASVEGPEDNGFGEAIYTPSAKRNRRLYLQGENRRKNVRR